MRKPSFIPAFLAYLLALASIPVHAAPFVISDPYPANGPQPTEFVITVSGQSAPVIVPATATAQGTILSRDVAGIAGWKRSRRKRATHGESPPRAALSPSPLERRPRPAGLVSRPNNPSSEMMLPWGNFLRPKDSLGRESRTLFFVAVSWLMMTLRFMAGGLAFEYGPIHWDIAPALVTDYGVAVAAVIAVWVGREWVRGKTDA